MRSLILLIIRYHFFILFIFIETYCTYLIVQNNHFHRAGFLNSANSVAANILNTISNVREYVSLKSENESLARENAELLGQMASGNLQITLDSLTLRDSLYIESDSTYKVYEYTTARIINNSVNRRNNYLTLDKGALLGIESEMGVISSNGVVGIIKNVSPHFSTVMSVLHKDIRLSTKLKKSEFFGSLSWDGTDPASATLSDIPKNAIIGLGDTVVTTGYSSIFPEGIMIGIVEKSRIDQGDNFHTITIRLTTNFSNLTHVYIVKNNLREERKNIEEVSHD
jgi:rod shape-determining protein MreC